MQQSVRCLVLLHQRYLWFLVQHSCILFHNKNKESIVLEITGFDFDLLLASRLVTYTSFIDSKKKCKT
jgi:hypothetical protein